MRKSKILITGASGCVGQYTASWLLENSDADLLLWLRDPNKLGAIDPSNPRVKLLIGDLRESNLFAKELATVNRVIHTATAWGDPKRAYQVNIKAVKSLIKLLNQNELEQFIYFSTASILNKKLNPLPEAFLYGTEYIQTKAKCLQELEAHPIAPKTIAIFPTLVFGGKVDGTSNFPSSYLTDGLTKAIDWLWLARWIKVYSRFHFIHAADIAFVCGHLSTTPHLPNRESGQGALKRLVLAQPYITIDQAIDTLAKWRGWRKTPKLPLWGWLVNILIKILPIQLSKWDRFSIKQRHFNHAPITNPENYGGVSHAKTLEEVLLDSGLSKSDKTRKRAKV
ncbi:NAD(P)-dependent oxidoreductase [Prochlorococcus sp. MIT 1307]|uniref:NAD-dependent epimerase/dehydratase family protein n=1 Tax=Prochlorococcus sp. MIT 1307 TaxID=3096219 RepID=UPI002A766A84|nr:NAD(P)-dependent oxidoreductase [Prochlorococcus sp. MIT 1307]